MSINKIIFTLPYRAGGVAMIVKNIIDYIDIPAEQMEVILIKNTGDPRASKPDNFKAKKTTVFDFSLKENRYYVYKRFCNLFDENSLLITNGNFELKAINSIKRKNKIIHILHTSQDFDLEIVKRYSGVIDSVVGVSKYICEKVSSVIGNNSVEIQQIMQPVPEVKKRKEANYDNFLRLIFVGRLIEAKGIYDLPKIDKALLNKNIEVKWTIVGFGPEEEKLKKKWFFNSSVNWTGKLSSNEILDFYPENDILLLPSHSEGFPVVLIEAMKCGLVPLVSDLPSGVPEAVNSGKNGYIFPIESPVKYAEHIEMLEKDRNLLEELSKNAILTTKFKFDQKKQVTKYLDLIYKILKKTTCKKQYIREINGKLDKKFVPNFFVKLLRKKFKK